MHHNLMLELETEIPVIQTVMQRGVIQSMKW